MNTLQVATVGPVVGDKLGDDGEGPGRVDRLAGAVKLPVAEAVRVEVAAVLVADGVVPVAAGAAVDALAAGLLVDGADVRGVGCRVRVCFPDVHFRAADAVFACA